MSSAGSPSPHEHAGHDHAGHEHAGHNHAGHDHAGHDHAALFDDAEVAAFLDLEAEVLIGFVDQALDVLADVGASRSPDERWPERIVDLGCGVGTASRRMADRFPGATVVGVDGAGAMVDRAVQRTAAGERSGDHKRVSFVRRDLDDDLSDLAPASIVWASMALHHVGDEAGLLRRMASLLTSSGDGGPGLLALVEFGDPLQVELPDGDDGARWARANDAFARWFVDLRASLPGAVERRADHAELLEAAGLEVVVDRLLAVDLVPPLTGQQAAFARGWVARSASRLEGYLDPDDVAALRRASETGADGDRFAPGRWTRARLRASRRLLVARRPDGQASGGPKS